MLHLRLHFQKSSNIPLRHPPASRLPALMCRFWSPFCTSKNCPPHFENHSAAYAGTDEWSRKQNCTKMAGAHPKPQFSVAECGKILLKYTETVNFMETIRRFGFQRQFPNRNIHYCWHSYSIVHYCLYGVLWFGNCHWKLLIVFRTLYQCLDTLKP